MALSKLSGSKNLKALKAIAFGIFACLLLYSVLWIYSANQLKHKLKETIYSSEKTILSFDKIEIYGFPFKLKAKVNNLYFRYRINNNVINSSFELFSNNISVKTNLLFNHAIISFPNKSSVIFTHDNKSSKFDINSDHDHYLEIFDKNFINLHKIIKSLYKKKLPEKDDFNLARIIYHSKNLYFLDKESKNEIMHSDAKIDSKMQYQENRISFLELQTTNFIKIKDKKTLDTFLSDIFSEIDFYASVKPNEHILIINKTELRKLKLKINDLNISALGTTEIDKSKNTIVNFELQIHHLASFLEDLSKNNIISSGRKVIIENLFHEITGKDSFDGILTIPIYSAKDESIRLGNADMSILSSYAQLFLFGK